jgi:hypothetical protein
MARSRKALALVGIVVLAASTSACASTNAGKLAPGERTVYVAAIEPKGSTSVEKEPFPAESLPPGGGYALNEPDDTGTWTVETYRWLPSEITVVEGDQVTLEILGVNGASHPSTLEGYDIPFEVARGKITKVSFTADKPGTFRFICSVHGPTMTGTLVVLPAN